MSPRNTPNPRKSEEDRFRLGKTPPPFLVPRYFRWFVGSIARQNEDSTACELERVVINALVLEPFRSERREPRQRIGVNPLHPPTGNSVEPEILFSQSAQSSDPEDTEPNSPSARWPLWLGSVSGSSVTPVFG